MTAQLRRGIRGVDTGWLERELVSLDMGHVVDAPLCPPHRYRIEEANGSPTVWGRCQICGHTRWYNAGSHYDGSFWHPGRDMRDLL